MHKSEMQSTYENESFNQQAYPVRLVQEITNASKKPVNEVFKASEADRGPARRKIDKIQETQKEEGVKQTRRKAARS